MIPINDEMIKQRSYDISKEPLTSLPSICLPRQNSIVSLEVAVEPLLSLLPNLLTFVQIAKEKCSNPSDGLTSDESASIMLYSMDWEPIEQCLYYVLNSTLRCDDRERLKPWFSYLSLFVQALSRLPSISVTIYQQVQIDLTERYPFGQRFLWCAFPLCKLSLEIFPSNETNPQTLFTIECHAGKDIRRHSYYSNEDQILIIAGSEFEVLSSS